MLSRRFRKVLDCSQVPAGRLMTAALGVLLLGGQLSQSAAAQTTSTPGARSKPTATTLSAQDLEVNKRAKRQVPDAQIAVQTTNSSSTSAFNTDQGPGPGPIGPGPGCNLFPQ